MFDLVIPPFTGQPRSSRNSCHRAFLVDDLPAPSDSSQVEARKGHELRTQGYRFDYFEFMTLNLTETEVEEYRFD